MKLKFFISAGLLFISGQAFAAKYCSTPELVYSLEFKNINVNPGLQVGDIISESGSLPKTVTCSDVKGKVLGSVFPGDDIEESGVVVNIHGIGCSVMNSGYPGLGIAWLNYNSGTGAWACGSKKAGLWRGLTNSRDDSSSVDIVDEIYLIKTGVIEAGNFVFNQEFYFDEKSSPSSGEVNFGRLYTIKMTGRSVIEAPVCIAVAKQGKGRYQFSTNDALNKLFVTEDKIIDVTCTGYIENGTIVPYKIISANGVYSQEPNFFGTSDAGLGVSIKYKNNSDSAENTLSPADRVNVVINNNKSTFGLKFLPYVKNGTGVYPLESEVNFDITISPGR